MKDNKVYLRVTLKEPGLFTNGEYQVEEGTIVGQKGNQYFPTYVVKNSQGKLFEVESSCVYFNLAPNKQ